MLALAADAPAADPATAPTTAASTSAASPAAAAGAEAKGSPKRVHKDLDDHEGNRMSYDVDETGKVSNVTARDRHGKALEVYDLDMKDVSICAARKSGKPGSAGAKDGKGKRAEPLCQPLLFMSSDAFFKMGTASCTCRVTSTGSLKCYGYPCP